VIPSRALKDRCDNAWHIVPLGGTMEKKGENSEKRTLGHGAGMECLDPARIGVISSAAWTVYDVSRGVLRG
jgi:hypothetical protein